MSRVTVEDIDAVVDALLTNSKAGDVQSIRELFQRLFGPPVDCDLLERLARVEAALSRMEKPDAPSHDQAGIDRESHEEPAPLGVPDVRWDG